jgi:hypothetical protein
VLTNVMPDCLNSLATVSPASPATTAVIAAIEVVAVVGVPIGGVEGGQLVPMFGHQPGELGQPAPQVRE